jgi:glutathione S-transferase
MTIESQQEAVGTTRYRLISYSLCPYVQRAVIALEEKGADYEIEYIDLAHKPAWFLELSPLGKVPILQVGGEVIFESAVISEFIDETAGGPRLHPADPLQRAKHRAWVEFTSATLVDAYRLQMAADEGRAREHAATVRERLHRYEEQLGDGPYFSGPVFSLVDAAAAPLLQRLGYCDELGAGLGLFSGRPRVGRWRDALLARPSVQRSSIAELRQLFFDYLRSGGAQRTGPSWLGKLVS